MSQQRIQKLEAILDVAKSMATQHDLGILLELIINHARKVAGADRATIFLLDKEKHELWSRVAHGGREIRLPANKGIVGRVVETKKALNIRDAYADKRFNPEIDKVSGYRTRNLLTVPMLSTQEEVVGVLQVLNKHASADRGMPRGSSAIRLRKSPTEAHFDSEDEEMLLAFAGQGAAAIENAILYDEINNLFEGFISASVVAIESRDPTTSGHSERVARLTCHLAETVDRIDSGPLACIHFDYDQMKEIRYASILHDFGKVGVREQVLVKAEKLYPADLAVLVSRFDFIRRTLEKEALERKLPAEESVRQLEELEDIRRFVLACNIPTVLDKGGFERLREIASRTYSSFDDAKPFLTDYELHSLSIPRGSLTEKDRLDIESHVTHTYRFLSTIPWTRKLRQVSEIAYAHHEKLDGRGYPRAVSGKAIPIQTQMMTISDIYDALTASDRPYKKAVPTQKALDILASEAETGKVNSDLLGLFVDAKIYEKTTRA